MNIEERNRRVPVQVRNSNHPDSTPHTPDNKWIWGALIILAPAIACAFTGDAASTRIENFLGTPPQVAETIRYLAFMAKCGLATGGIAGAGIGLTRLLRRE